MSAALVTGTTSGIGKAFAERLAAEGYDIALASRDEEKLRAQKAELEERFPVRVEYVCRDLARPGAAAAVMDAVRASGLTVDILINNAGFNEAGSFTDTSLERELDMIQTHARALTELTKLALPGMIERGSGRILNVGSTGSYAPCPNDAVYAATKAYVVSFSQALCRELKGTGVSVTCLCPGATRTLFADKAGLSDAPLFRRFVMSPERVADAGCRALLRGRGTSVPGLYNKILVFFSKALPASVAGAMARRMMTP